jgi:hypothetical protein
MKASSEQIHKRFEEWKEGEKPLTIIFFGETQSLRRTGRILGAYLGSFDIGWDDDGSTQTIPYGDGHIEGESLTLLYTADGSSVFLTES